MQGVARELGLDIGVNFEGTFKFLITFWHYCIVYIAYIFCINVKRGEKMYIIEKMYIV